MKPTIPHGMLMGEASGGVLEVFSPPWWRVWLWAPWFGTIVLDRVWAWAGRARPGPRRGRVTVDFADGSRVTVWVRERRDPRSRGE